MNKQLMDSIKPSKLCRIIEKIFGGLFILQESNYDTAS